MDETTMDLQRLTAALRLALAEQQSLAQRGARGGARAAARVEALLAAIARLRPPAGYTMSARRRSSATAPHQSWAPRAA